MAKFEPSRDLTATHRRVWTSSNGHNGNIMLRQRFAPLNCLAYLLFFADSNGKTAELELVVSTIRWILCHIVSFARDSREQTVAVDMQRQQRVTYRMFHYSIDVVGNS